jgi:hypothetical protein
VYSGPNIQLLGSSCTLHQINARHKHDMSIVSRAFGLVHELRPEVIQTWMLQMDLIGGAAARFFRRPWVLAERSSALGYPPSALNRLRLWSGRGATAIGRKLQRRSRILGGTRRRPLKDYDCGKRVERRRDRRGRACERRRTRIG